MHGPETVGKWLPLCAFQLSAPCRHFVHRCQSSQVAEEQSKVGKNKVGATGCWVQGEKGGIKSNKLWKGVQIEEE